MLKIFESPLLRQYGVVIIVNLSVLATGVGITWPSPILVKLTDENQTILPNPVTDGQGAWIVSIGFLTAIVASLIIGSFLVDRIRRKYCLILVCLPKLVAGFLFLFATDVWMLMLGRALIGAGDAGIFVLLPMYASEVASKEIRGALGSILQIMCSFGVVIMLSVGPFVSYTAVNIMFISILVCTTLALLVLPDSPYSAYSNGHKEEALKTLIFLRGSEALANEEINEYEMASKKTTEKISKREILTNRTFLKSLVLVFIIGVGAQLIGFNAVQFYLQTVLESTGTSVSSEIASVVIGCIQVFASFCTMVVTDRFGRKPILIVTCIGIGLGMFGLGLFFHLTQDGIVEGFMNYLPLISLILVVFCYSSGIGSLMWVLNAELFDDKCRGFGMSLAMVSTNLFTFLTTNYFAAVTAALGPDITYWIFSANSFIICVFIIFFIPETKGKSFTEIQNILKNKKEDNVNKAS